jgi:hypothetical protein
MAEELPKKNIVNSYIILIVIFIVCMGLVLYFCKWYKVYDEYQKQTPVIRDSLYEIVNDDLEHFVLENPSTVIYMCTASDNACRSFEKDFKKLIAQEELNDEIVYLNLSDLDQDEFVRNFNEKYNYKIKLTTHYPAFVVFEDGKVVSVLQSSEDETLTTSKVKQFLELNNIGE